MTDQLSHGVFLDLETVDNGDLDRTALGRTLARWDWHDFSDPDAIVERVASADVVISNKCVLDAPVMDAAPRLKLIVLAATGTDNVELQAAGQRGIAVSNIRDYATEAVAQHAITLTLNLLTAQPWYWNSVRRGDWSHSQQFCLNDRPIRQAAGLRFGVIGAGVLGTATARLAQALGMEVMLAERRGEPVREGRVAFDEVVREADVISLHCPLTDQTRGMIDGAVLQAMKPDALLINTSRGAIVSEHDLAESLRQGIIAGAGIDVLSQEPPPPDHCLLAADIPNLLITPHNAWASKTARQAALDQIARVIASYGTGELLNRVN